jgi:defect-in-organelle-trafficking protein DotC
MNMDEIRDLKHPYFDKHLSNLTDDDVEEIMNNKMQHKFKGLRENSIHDEAIKYGIQSALYKILSDFSLKMDNISPFYENTFNFNSLMLYNGRVKPPVVLKTMGSLAKENKKLLRQVKRAYNFHSQAEVVIRPPSFRDYLTFEAIRPTEPNPLLLPLPNKPKEMHVWQKGVSEGWIQGLRQAYLVIDEGLISLVRDFFGMQRYIGMLDEGIVTLPVVTESDLATSSNGTSINIGESTFTISELPEFNTNDHTWRAIPRVDGIFNNFYLDDKDKEKLKLLKEELEIDKY